MYDARPVAGSGFESIAEFVPCVGVVNDTNDQS